MLTIHSTEADPAAGAAATPESQDGLAVYLAQHGVPPATWCKRRSRLWPM